MEIKKRHREFRCSFVYYLRGDLKKRIFGLQKESYKITGSKASFKLWEPHITVAPPVWVADEKTLDEVFDEVRLAISNIRPFELKISGFGFSSYERYSHVVYLLVENNKHLKMLNRRLVESLSKKFRHDYFWPPSYNYHVTVSYKDLTKSAFATAKAYFGQKTFEDVTTLNHVAVVKEEKTGKATEVKRFELS